MLSELPPDPACSPVRIWFNRNVSGTYQLIAMLRAGDVPVEVFGSYPRADHLMLQACDYADVEPVLDGPEAYVAWALGFAARHGIDVLVPGELHQAELAAAAGRFAAQGTLVQSSSAAVVTLLADKAATYRAAAALGIAVPAYEVVYDGPGLRAAYARLVGAGHRVTVKPVEGFGGQGFWELVDRSADLATLLGPPERVMGVEVAAGILDRGPAAPALLVSQWLHDPEDSVDVLAHDGRCLAAVVRRKPAVGQTRSFPHDPEVLALTTRLVEGIGLDYLANVQWRRDDHDRPVLLEVNTRAAAGLYQSCATGVDFAGLALRLRLGLPVDVPVPGSVPDQVTYTDSVPMRPLTPARLAPVAEPLPATG